MDDLVKIIKDDKRYSRILDDIVKYPCDKDDRVKNPNLYKFKHGGITCKLRRNMFGNWCGYETAKLTINNILEIPVHGGVTYIDKKDIGFDTCHIKDLSLDDILLSKVPDLKIEDYKDYNFVVNEVKRLAETIQ